MRKRSALALTMIGGLQAATTTWAGVAPLIEAMRQTEVTGKPDKPLALLPGIQGFPADKGVLGGDGPGAG